MKIPSLAVMFVFSLSWSVLAGTFKPDSNFRPKVQSPVFVKSHPVVLIDKGHLNLAINDGRYKPIVHLLESDGFKVIPLKGKVRAEFLKRADIFYVSGAQGHAVGASGGPSSAFSADETQVIEQWVRSGGSLLLMSDHAPIGDSIHDLARRLGAEISGGETNDPNHFFLALEDQSHLVFSEQNGLLGDHPIIHGRAEAQRVKRVVAFSGQAVRGPVGSKNILNLSSSAITAHKDRPSEPIPAEYSEAVAFRVGRGRVVIFGDATVFTSKIHTIKNEKEGMNRGDLDNVALATNTFRWLARALGD